MAKKKVQALEIDQIKKVAVEIKKFVKKDTWKIVAQIGDEVRIIRVSLPAVIVEHVKTKNKFTMQVEELEK